ncbi:hypothetical protein WA158_001884 [Blastocystis sp. Blastoise]
MKFLFLLFIVLVLAYDPSWESVDSRPLPNWFDEAKLGIFIHWGVYSVPAFKSEWYWIWLTEGDKDINEFHNKTFGHDFKYQDFVKDFKAEMYDPERWAEVFEKSGAKYVVLTSKHHDGFSLFPTKYAWNWNSKDLNPHRDLVGELATAVRKHNMTFGAYHSLFEWYNPIYLEDKKNGYKTQEYVNNHYLPMFKELVNTYKPELLWVDGDGRVDSSYWKSPEFLAWLYNESPVKDTVVVNDRWGSDCSQKHGGYYSGPDRFEPGHLLPHKWENAMTIQKDSWAWGYDRREDFYTNKYFSLKELLLKFIPTVAYGGNMLLNVSPTADGRIMPLMQERLIQLGDWMKVNGEAIYKSVPWRVQEEDKKVYFTERKDLNAIYAILTEWPIDNTVTLSSPQLTENTKMSLMGSDKPVEYKQDGENIIITLPSLNIRQIPCQEFYVIKMTNIN